jgi:hypothetical protein
MEPALPHKQFGRGLGARISAWSAMLIAVASLGITLYEARATREHDRMSVWPRLAQESSDSAGSYDRAITNVGLGPALIRSYEIRLDDTVRTSWSPIVSALAGSSTPRSWFFSSVGAGTVILPGHSINVLTIVGAGVDMRRDRRVVGRVCYCSLYGECWMAASDRADPWPVSSCDERTGRIGS